MVIKKRTKTDYIVIHCTATPEGRDDTLADIDRMHRERGFEMIGYHYLIRLDGTIEAGRHVNSVGAHVSGKNAVSIGIAYVGGVSADNVKIAKDTRTPAQRDAMAGLVRTLTRLLPRAKVLGHRDFKGVKKACPCFDVADWLEEDAVLT